MTYRCRCEDGPAAGVEFQDYGPPVRVGLPHKGQILDYHLYDITAQHCLYHFHERGVSSPDVGSRWRTP
jgi:hypothetical protein